VAPRFGYVLSMSVKPGGGLVCQLAAAAIAALSLVACGSSSSAPKSLPQLPKTAVSPSASPSPTPTTLSKKAELAAARAVVEQYYALLNASTTLANANSLAQLMTSDCTCRSVVRSTVRAARHHERYYGKNHLQTAAPKLNGSVIDVLVLYSYTDGGLENAAGQHLSHAPGMKDVRFDFHVVRSATPKIAEIVMLDKGHPA
jgi:hypothetical protein